jgi:hypothetical protein
MRGCGSRQCCCHTCQGGSNDGRAILTAVIGCFGTITAALIGAVATVIAVQPQQRPTETPPVNLPPQQCKPVCDPLLPPHSPLKRNAPPALPLHKPSSEDPTAFIDAEEEPHVKAKTEPARPTPTYKKTEKMGAARRPELPQLPAVARRMTSDRPAPSKVQVETLARLENFLLAEGRPFLALEEKIDLTIAGHSLQLCLALNGEREASESVDLPEGEHYYTLRSSARARAIPESGGWLDSRVLPLSGSGEGTVLVMRGSRLALKREACRGRRYAVSLEHCR